MTARPGLRCVYRAPTGRVYPARIVRVADGALDIIITAGPLAEVSACLRSPRERRRIVLAPPAQERHSCRT